MQFRNVKLHTRSYVAGKWQSQGHGWQDLDQKGPGGPCQGGWRNEKPCKDAMQLLILEGRLEGKG